MIQPLAGLFQGRDMARLDPPHHEMRCRGLFEILALASVNLRVGGLPDEFLQRLHALPHGEIDRHGGIAHPGYVGGVAAVVLQPPDKTRHAFGGGVDAVQIVEKPRHGGIVLPAFQLADVELRQVPHHSAASLWPARSAMRRSISGRKWRIRPWIGQAAASPRAQMVWPSISLETSCRRSISGTFASPLTMRVITRHIHP